MEVCTTSQARDEVPKGRAKKMQTILPPGPSNKQESDNAPQGYDAEDCKGYCKIAQLSPIQSRPGNH